MREGFSFWAFILAPVWLLLNRLWLPALVYIMAVSAMQEIGERMGLSPATMGIVQIGLQFWLGCTAYDIQRWVLAQRGYKPCAIIAATSRMEAEKRAYRECLAEVQLG